MYPRRPPPPRERLNTDQSSNAISLAPSSRGSFTQEATRSDIAVVNQTPNGLPVVERRPATEYYTLFENLLAESLDAQAPGFGDAVEALIDWKGREEAPKVDSINNLLSQLATLREEKQRLTAELHEALASRENDEEQQQMFKKVVAERDEYKEAVGILEQDMHEQLAENAELVEALKALKQKPQPEKAKLKASPESFVRAEDFAEEAEQVEILLRSDIEYVSRGESARVGWNDAYQLTVNGEVAKCAEDPARPWRSDGPLFHSGFSVLHVAALMGSVEMVRAWLAQGVECCSTDARGNTVLHLCLMAERMRAAQLGFTGQEELSVVTAICDWLKAQDLRDALLRLVFLPNRSGLALVSEHGGGPLCVPQQLKPYLSDALDHLLAHQRPGGRYLYDWRACAPQLERAGIEIARNSGISEFKILVNFDQKKDNLLSYRVTRPELRFGDESQLSYSMLGCDQLGYGVGQVNDRGLAFSTLGSVITISPCIDRQNAHVVLVAGTLYVYSQPAALGEQAIALSRMRRYPLSTLTLLHLMEGYESMVLLRLNEDANRSSALPLGSGSYDLVIETKYKPHFVLALCLHYYEFCKPDLSAAAYSRATVTQEATPLRTDLNHYSAIPLFDGDDTPEAVIVQTRFPHANLLGEVLIVRTRTASAIERYLQPFRKVSTVYYIANMRDWLRAPFAPAVAQPAICLLHHNMTLELFAAPTDDAAQALYRIDLYPPTRLVTPYPLDSDAPPAGSPPSVTSGLFTRISKLLDITQIASEKAWYAITFQENKSESADSAAAIGFEIKEERDEWICLLYS